MADGNTQELKLHIVSDADTKGFTQMAAAGNDLTNATKNSTTATGEAAAADKAATGDVEGLSLKKRELLEVTESLRKAFPELGDAMRAVYNPVGFSVFGIVSAFALWISRVETLTAALGGIELPDLSSGIKDAHDVAVAYDGIAKAVRGADEEFNNAASAFERQQKAIAAQLTATKLLIAAQKEKAIADLDQERENGQISPGEYIAKKAIIEQGFNDKTTQAEIDARNNDLAAKKTEASRLQKTADEKSAAAAAIKLPADDNEVDAQIAAEKALADDFKKQAQDHRQNATVLNQREEEYEAANDSSNPLKKIAVVPDLAKTIGTYGFTAAPQSIETAAARAAEDSERAARKSAQYIEKQKADRDRLRTESETATAAAEKARLEIQGEDDPSKIGSTAWQNAQAKAAQQIRDAANSENRFSSDAAAVGQDVQQFDQYKNKTDPQSIAKAHQVLADMYGALDDAQTVIKTLVANGDDVSKLRQKLAALQAQVNSLNQGTR